MAHSSKNNLLITRYLTLLKNEFRGYGASSLLSDFVAGITVGAVALPLALAFGAGAVFVRTDGTVTTVGDVVFSQ